MSSHIRKIIYLSPLLFLLWITNYFNFINSQYMYPFYGPSYPAVPTARTPTFLPNANRNSTIGFYSNVPYDVDDSFTNYDWEPTIEDEHSDAHDENGVEIPRYSYNPTDGPNTPVSHGHSGNTNRINIPIRPHDYYAVYMDANEDAFDGIPNSRFNRRPDAIQPHNVLLSGEAINPPRPENSATNVPLGRQYGFNNVPSYMRDRSSFDNYYHNGFNNNEERFIDVNFMDIIRSRTYFTPPHFPGLQ